MSEVCRAGCISGYTGKDYCHFHTSKKLCQIQNNTIIITKESPLTRPRRCFDHSVSWLWHLLCRGRGKGEEESTPDLGPDWGTTPPPILSPCLPPSLPCPGKDLGPEAGRGPGKMVRFHTVLPKVKIWLVYFVHSIRNSCFAVILWTGCFGHWLKYLTRDQVKPDTWMDCKLGYFLFYFGRHYSSMLLVLMSVEKCFAVYFPLKSKTVCTVKAAKWVTSIVGVILVGYDSIYFFIVKSKVLESSGHRACVASVDSEKFDFVFPVDSALYSFGPFVLMFITNFAIVLKFMTAKCKSVQGNYSESTSKALVKSATRGTAMVVTVSITFIILTAPTAVNEAFRHVNNLSQYPMYRVFMNFTQYLNHSINGLLYCIAGTRFRKELLKIFCRKQRAESVSTSRSIYRASTRTVRRNWLFWNIFLLAPTALLGSVNVGYNMWETCTYLFWQLEPKTCFICSSNCIFVRMNWMLYLIHLHVISANWHYHHHMLSKVIQK